MKSVGSWHLVRHLIADKSSFLPYGGFEQGTESLLFLFMARESLDSRTWSLGFLKVSPALRQTQRAEFAEESRVSLAPLERVTPQLWLHRCLDPGGGLLKLSGQRPGLPGKETSLLRCPFLPTGRDTSRPPGAVQWRIL